MKIVTWNVRGAANVRFCMNAQDLVNTHHHEILVILEPKISGTHAEHVINQVGLSHHFQVDPNGMSGGIWVLWEDHRCNLDIVHITEQCNHACLAKPWAVHVEHIWREANNCADMLAKRGASQFERVIIYDTSFLLQCLF